MTSFTNRGSAYPVRATVRPESAVPVFDKRTGQQHHTLLSAGELKETTVFQVGNAENIHPPHARIHILLLRLTVQTDGIMQSTGYNVNGGRFFR